MSDHGNASAPNQGADAKAKAKAEQQKCLDFKLIWDDVKAGRQVTLHMVAPSRQEKAAWVTDIAQVN